MEGMAWRRKILMAGKVPTLNTEVGPPTQKLVPVCNDLLESSAAAVSKEFVFDVYDKIAPHFSHTRYKMWPKVAEFVASLPVGDFLMDAGCGNGKNLMSASHLVRFGSDRSQPFCEMAGKNGNCDAVQCDIARDLGKAFRESSFDAVIAIAVIHHIPTFQGRVDSLREIHRLLRHEGRALIYVWAMEQRSGSIGARTFDSQDIYVPWNLQSKYLKPEHGVEEGHIVPLKRYYHVFTEAEFRELFDAVPELEVVSVYYDNNNWAAEVRAIKK
jgi:SAM-dependent methyltransferase